MNESGDRQCGRADDSASSGGTPTQADLLMPYSVYGRSSDTYCWHPVLGAGLRQPSGLGCRSDFMPPVAWSWDLRYPTGTDWDPGTVVNEKHNQPLVVSLGTTLPRLHAIIHPDDCLHTQETTTRPGNMKTIERPQRLNVAAASTDRRCCITVSRSSSRPSVSLIASW